MATRPERQLKQTENVKENSKNKKSPFQSGSVHLRAPLQPANNGRHGQKSSAPAGVKQPPVGHLKKNKEKCLMSADKCAARDRIVQSSGGASKEIVQTNVDSAQGAVAMKPQSQSPTLSTTQSRREQLELWRRQKNESNRMAAPKHLSHPSLASNPQKRKAVTTAPTSLHQKPWCTTTRTSPPPQKRPVPSLSAVKSSLTSSLTVKNHPLLKVRQPVVRGSTSSLEKTQVAGSGNDFKCSMTKRGNGKTHLQITGSINDVRRPLNKSNIGHALPHVIGSRNVLKHPLTRSSIRRAQPPVASSRNDTKQSQAELCSRKRQTLCLGSLQDRKQCLISGPRLSGVKPRPASQLSMKISALSNQVLPSSPSRRKSKRFVRVKACVDSNLTALRNRSRMTCSPHLKHTGVSSRRVNPNHSMPAHAKKTSAMALNLKPSVGVSKSHPHMTRSPRHKPKLVPSCGVNTMHSLPAHACKTLPGLKSRKSIAVSVRSARQLPADNRTPTRSLANKAVVNFATPVVTKSAWAKSKVTPACIPLQKEQSMREKLEAWLTSRGKTPSKFSHMMCFGHSSSHSVTTRTPLSCQHHQHKQSFGLSDSALVPDSVQLMVEVTDGETVGKCHPPKRETLDGLLSECLLLLQESDCPAELVQEWVKEIATVPGALHHAKFWIVKAALAEGSGESNDAVVNIFEQAFRHKVQPPEEMATALKGFVERMAKRCKNVADEKTQDVKENMFESSAVKYCMSNTTVFFKRVRSRIDVIPGRFTPRAIITPVRRSTRKSLAALPIMLQEHDTTYDALDEVPEDLQPCTLFRPNEALQECEEM